MIDISDGLASEVNHVCRQSGVGAEVFAKDIPLHPDVIDAGRNVRDPTGGFRLERRGRL
jgi:thiamine-monophosphate kinase